MNKELQTWQDCLQKVPFSLALPEYKCGVYAQRQRLCEKRPRWWAPYLAAMSREALLVAEEQDHPRLSDVCRLCRERGLPFWNRRFVYGNRIEGGVQGGDEDALGLLGYVGSSLTLQGVSKSDLARQMRGFPHIGRFYAQHGLILMSSGGRDDVLRRMGVRRVQSEVIAGDGALRLVGLLQGPKCPPQVTATPANEAWITKARHQPQLGRPRLSTVINLACQNLLSSGKFQWVKRVRAWPQVLLQERDAFARVAESLVEKGEISAEASRRSAVALSAVVQGPVCY